MTPWIAVVLAPPEGEHGPMASSLPSFLHPVAGRPLIWHSVNSLLAQDSPPEEVVVLVPPELADGELFQGLPVEVRTEEFDFSGVSDPASVAIPDGRILLAHASAGIEAEPLRRLLDGEVGTWVAGPDGEVVALVSDGDQVTELLGAPRPFAAAAGLVEPDRRLSDTRGVVLVRSRIDLVRAHQRIRDGLVRSLMEAGATFILPETVVVDVDVRIGRDTIIYPGAVIEGQSTIGEETVIGPGCRIIDSWIGSGVELKGWNYIAHTSVRNRAILEPYVRRGFD